MKDKKIPINSEKKFKELIKISKNKGLIKPHVQAFQEIPVKEEKHKGKTNYFCE